MQCYALIHADGSLVRTVTNTTYITFDKTERAARISLTLELMLDKFLGLCRDTADIFIDRVSSDMFDWNTEVQQVEDYLHVNKGKLFKDKLSCIFWSGICDLERVAILTYTILTVKRLEIERHGVFKTIKGMSTLFIK